MDAIKFVDKLSGFALNSNPFFDTGSVSPWTSLNATSTLSLDSTQTREGNNQSLLITPVGGNATVEVRSEIVSVTTGATYVGFGWLRCAVDRQMSLGILWRDNGGVFLSSSLQGLNITANTWTPVTVTAVAPASAVQAQLIVSMGSTPPPSHLVWVNEGSITPQSTGGAASKIRLDLNDGTTWAVNYEGTDFSPPPLKQAWSDTLLTNGERLSAAAYGNRTIQLALDLITSNQDTAAAELHKLWTELNRQSNFLMYQPTGASKPVYFRTIRSSNTRVTEYPNGAIRTVQVTIDAEPFAYGPKVQLPASTVVNDPNPPSSLGANGMYFSVDRPLGDVETPLYLKLANQSPSDLVRTTSAGPPLTLISVRRRGNPAATPLVMEAESMTLSASITKPQRDQASTAEQYTGAPMALNKNNGDKSTMADASNWTGTNCTVDYVQATNPDAVTSGYMRITPNGTSAQVYAESEKVPVTTGARYTASAALWSNTTRNFDIYIRWYDAANTFLSASTITAPVTANTWLSTDYDITAAAPASATQATVAIGMTGTPPASNLLYVYTGWIKVGPLNINEGFEADALNWTATGGTLTRQTTTTWVGLASGQLTPTGAAATTSVENDRVAVTPGKPYSATARIRNAVARSVDTKINWYTSGLTLITTTPVTTSLAANTWTAVEAGGVAPSNAAFASISFVMTGTPPASNILYIDTARVDPSPAVRIDTAGLSTWTTAMWGTFPTPPSAIDARGTYRVFMRYAYATTGVTATNDVRLRWGGKEAMITNPEVLSLEKNGTQLKYIDLGLVQIPGGYDPAQDGISGVDLASEGIYFELQIKDNSGAFVDLDVDHFLFAPADDRLLLIRWATVGSTSITQPDSMLLDSLAGQVYGLNATGQVYTLPGTELAGGPPMITPGVINRIFFCADVGRETSTTTTRRLKATITPHYWPRYLTVRAASA